MHMAVLPAWMSAHYAYAVPEETRRQHPSLWNRSDRWLLAIFCGYRELNPGPRESSRCLNSGATSRTPWFLLFNSLFSSLSVWLKLCQFFWFFLNNWIGVIEYFLLLIAIVSVLPIPNLLLISVFILLDLGIISLVSIGFVVFIFYNTIY